MCLMINIDILPLRRFLKVDIMISVDKDLLTTDEAMLYTGLKRPTLYKMVSSRQIPYHKSRGGKKLYFRKDDLIAWMTDKHVTSNLTT